MHGCVPGCISVREPDEERRRARSSCRGGIRMEIERCATSPRGFESELQPFERRGPDGLVRGTYAGKVETGGIGLGRAVEAGNRHILRHTDAATSQPAVHNPSGRSVAQTHAVMPSEVSFSTFASCPAHSPSFLEMVSKSTSTTQSGRYSNSSDASAET
jgi:hypothetical protein